MNKFVKFEFSIYGVNHT